MAETLTEEEEEEEDDNRSDRLGTKEICSFAETDVVSVARKLSIKSRIYKYGIRTAIYSYSNKQYLIPRDVSLAHLNKVHHFV